MKVAQKRSRARAMGLINAVVARARGSDYKVSERERAYRYRIGMAQAFLKARKAVPPKDYVDFFADVAKVTALEESKFAKQPVNLDYLTILVSAPALPLDLEIMWSACRLAREASALNAFLLTQDEVSSALLNDDVDAALAALTRHEDESGTSLWSIETKVALLQWGAGTELQKAYVKDVKGVRKKGMLPYIATYLGQRAEDGVSIGWFLDNSRRRIDRLKKPEIAEYVGFRLLKHVPGNESAVASILRVEQNHHPIDIYETLVRILQVVTAGDASTVVRKAAERVVDLLSGVDDFRLHKLRRFLSPNKDTKKSLAAPTFAMDSLLQGKIGRALRICARNIKSRPGSIFDTITLAMARGASGSKKLTSIRRLNDLHRFLVGALESSLRRAGDEAQAPRNGFDSLRKFAHVFSTLPFAMVLLEFARAQRSVSSSDARLHYLRSAFNEAEVTLLDQVGLSASATAFADDYLSDKSVTRAFGRIIAGPPLQGATDSRLHELAASYAKTFALLASRRTTEAELEIERALRSDSRMVSSHAAILALEACVTNGSTGKACVVLSREHAEYLCDSEILPVEEVFAGLSWADMERFAQEISFSNALHMYAQLSLNDKAHSYACFALSVFLAAQKVSKPSELRERWANFKKNEFAYFLGQVCAANLLDMLPDVGTTREVLEERREICALLVTLGFDDSGDYRQELLVISRELSVQKGLQAIDGSRVHVDTDALRAIVRRDLSESFQRYLSLSKSDAGGADTFDVVLRELTRKDPNAKHLLSIPESEADELLVSMILRVRSRFLFDVPHGLDSYLSKRVRHGSIVGFIRAPAEREGIVTQQASDGSYRYNDKWLGSIESASVRKELENALASFARTFDQHLIRLKDVLLHVKSETHPLGIFDAPLYPPNYHLIRSIAIRDRSLDTFMNTIFAALWGLLNPSLQAASELLRRETLRFAVTQFDTLRASANAILAGQPGRVALDTAIGGASTRVQVAIESVASWFVPVTPEDCLFTMTDAVEIAVASVRAIFGEFDPDLEITAPDELLVSASNLAVLQDVLFIAFGNVAKWSGIEGPKIKVVVRHQAQEDLLRIEVRNDVAGVKEYESEVRRLEHIKKFLRETQDFEKARREGGSGLFKLASIVSQSKRASFDFGLISPTEFWLTVDLSFVAANGGNREDSDCRR